MKQTEIGSLPPDSRKDKIIALSSAGYRSTLNTEELRLLHAKMDTMEDLLSRSKQGKPGRPPKAAPAKKCVMVRFTDEEYARFLTMFEKSGMHSMARFIKGQVFDKAFRVIKMDRGVTEIATILSSHHALYRKIGVNYNQVVKMLYIHFSQKKALAMLYKLENETRNLIAVSEKIFATVQKLRQNDS